MPRKPKTGTAEKRSARHKPGHRLDRQLNTLEGSGLIDVAQMMPELEYLFRHALIQDAAYESMLKADRRILHRAIGETLERLYPEQLSELAARLGHHFALAGEAERARKYFILAGDSALAVYANVEAEQHYRAALNWATSGADKARALAGLGEVLDGQSRFEEAIQVWRESILFYQELQDDDTVARLYARSARTAWSAGDFQRGLTLAREGLAAVANSPATLGKALLLHDVGRACMFNQMKAEGLPLCDQALAIAEQLADVEAQADILSTLGTMLEPDRQLDQCVETLSKAAELADATQSLRVAFRTHHNLGQKLYNIRGDLRAGRDHLLRASEICRLMGNVANEFHNFSHTALAVLFLGDFVAVEAMLPTLQQLWRAIPDPTPYQIWLGAVEALLLRYRGELTEAVVTLRACYAQARQPSNPEWQYAIALLFAEALLEAGETQEAGRISTDFLELFAEEPWGGVVTARCVLSAMHLREGRIEEARRPLVEAREKFGSQITAFEAEDLSLAEARLAVAEKRWPEALAAFEATAQMQARMDKRWYRAQTLREWAEAHLSRNEPGDRDHARELLNESLALFEEMNVPKYAALVGNRIQSL